MYIKVEAEVIIQDTNIVYNIDISDLHINNILDWTVLNYNNSEGDFRVSDSETNFTEGEITICCDTNWGYDTKYDYDYIIYVIYE